MMPEKDQIEALLKRVIDPELAVNIVDLGLVYGIRLDEQAERIALDMTLTSAGCPLGDVIIEEAYHLLQSHFPDFGVDINLVWEPAWSLDRLTAEGRAALGR